MLRMANEKAMIYNIVRFTTSSLQVTEEAKRQNTCQNGTEASQSIQCPYDSKTYDTIVVQDRKQLKKAIP